MRFIFGLAAILVCIAGVQLYVLAASTETFFAWTITPPITAAFFGAEFFASMVLVLIAVRERYWANARVAAPGVFAFASLMLVTTALHLDRFHFSSSALSARVAAWAWIIVYVVVPPLLLIGLALQRRMKGAKPPDSAPLPWWFSAPVLIQSIARVAVGAALFIAPATAASLWMWKLTPLTARGTGAWLIGLSVAGIAAVLERDARRVRPAAYAYLALSILEASVLARFSSQVSWGKPATIVYLVFLASMLIASIVGVSLQRRYRDLTN